MNRLSLARPPVNRKPSPAQVGRDAARRRARERLERHAAIWSARPLLRQIYRRYHGTIDRARCSVAGSDIEIGAGHGSFAELRPNTVSCDIVPCPWLDCAADASRLPFADESLANIVMIDVLHHVDRPADFFDGAARALASGGRILLIEPYVSPVSWVAWHYFHNENIDIQARPLETDDSCEDLGASDPWEANVAVPTLLFWRDIEAFHRRFPVLSVIRRERFDSLLFPLSGGFEMRQWVPLSLAPVVRAVERLLTPFAPLLAFRCLVVIEKKAADIEVLPRCGTQTQ